MTRKTSVPIHLSRAIRRLLAHERAENVVIGGLAAVVTICFIASVLAILLMK